MILSFDILSRPSFESLENWIQDYFQWTGEVDDNVVVCGMKFDLSANRQVSKKVIPGFPSPNCSSRKIGCPHGPFTFSLSRANQLHCYFSYHAALLN